MQVIFRYQKIQTRRKEKRLTQEVLAECCDCSSRYLRDLEHGKKCNPSAVLLHLLTHALDISMEELLEIQYDEP